MPPTVRLRVEAQSKAFFEKRSTGPCYLADVEIIRSGKKRPPPPLVDGHWCRQMADDGHSAEEIADWLRVSAELVTAEIALSR